MKKLKAWSIRVALLSTMLLTGAETSAQSPKFSYLFQEAVRQKILNKYDAAIDLFDYCRQLDPQSGAVLYELADLYRYVKNDSLAIAALEKACLLYPDNYWYKNHLVSLYLENKRDEEALANVEEMSRQFPEKGEVLLMLLHLYEKKNDYAHMVEVLDRMEVKEGKSEQFSMDKFRLFLKMNNEERAFEEMKQLADEYPNDLRYQVVIGDLHLDAGRQEEALALYKEVEAKEPLNVSLLLSMTNYYNANDDKALYHDYLTKLLTHKDVDADTRARTLAVLVRENLTNQEDSTQLLDLFDKVLAEPQEQTDILELRVRYMVTKNMSPRQVTPWLMKILAIDPESDMARQQLLSYAVENDDTIGIVDICKPAIEYGTTNPVYYYYLGVGYFQMKKMEKAVEAFRGGLEHANNTPDGQAQRMKVNSYALMGDAYHYLGRDEDAFQAYDSCLVYKHNEPTVLNNYAYYLALKKKNLGRAEEMSRLANELDPDNATFLDTHAWVLYLLKRYDEAKQYMDRAVELMEKEDEEMSKDVLEHIKQINKKAKK